MRKAKIKYPKHQPKQKTLKPKGILKGGRLVGTTSIGNHWSSQPKAATAGVSEKTSPLKEADLTALTQNRKSPLNFINGLLGNWK